MTRARGDADGILVDSRFAQECPGRPVINMRDTERRVKVGIPAAGSLRDAGARDEPGDGRT